MSIKIANNQNKLNNDVKRSSVTMTDYVLALFPTLFRKIKDLGQNEKTVLRVSLRYLIWLAWVFCSSYVIMLFFWNYPLLNR